MSVVSDSPVHSSSSGDDFASFLDAELDSTSDTSPDPGDDDNDNDEDDDDENDNDYDSKLFRYILVVDCISINCLRSVV